VLEIDRLRKDTWV